jgi:hypothetical protein
MAGENTYKESDGKAVNVVLSYTVDKDQLCVVEGWLGIAGASGDSGDQIALSVDEYEYQLTVPSGLSVAKGDIVYITVADLTGHIPDDTAYTTSAGAGKVALMKATAAKDSNNVVTGIMMAKAALAS